MTMKQQQLIALGLIDQLSTLLKIALEEKMAEDTKTHITEELETIMCGVESFRERTDELI